MKNVWWCSHPYIDSVVFMKSKPKDTFTATQFCHINTHFLPQIKPTASAFSSRYLNTCIRLQFLLHGLAIFFARAASERLPSAHGPLAKGFRMHRRILNIYTQTHQHIYPFHNNYANISAG